MERALAVRKVFTDTKGGSYENLISQLTASPRSSTDAGLWRQKKVHHEPPPLAGVETNKKEYMGHRLPMKFTEKVTKIIEKAIAAHNDGLCTTFIEISGHVQQLRIRMFAPVWVGGSIPSKEYEVYLDSDDAGYYLGELDKSITTYTKSLSPIQSETEVSEG
jgi:hypothetical protein